MKHKFLLTGLILLFSLSISAQESGKETPAQPIQKAAQSDYQFTTPTDFVALQYG